MPTPYEKLDNMRSEVKELHPLLERLFKKIREITYSEHVHGSDEFGPDFILERVDPVLGVPDHIAVIVKRDTIRQDISGVDRQIEECTLNVNRTIRGKDPVRINEIWIITTGKITANAQRKLEAKYRNSKLRFIARDGLIQLLDKYLPEFWSEVEVDVGEYLGSVREDIEEADRRFSIVPYEQGGKFYIEQDVIRREYDPYRSKIRRKKRKVKKVDLHDEIRRVDFLIVEGGIGAGKSKLLRELALHYADPTVFLTEKLLPVPITFKQYVDEYGADLSTLLDAVSKDLKLDDDVAFLVLMDGMDEKKLGVEDQLEHLSQLRKAATENPRKTKVVLGSRYLRGLDSPNPLSSSLARYELRPLSLKRVTQFLLKLCERFNMSSRLVEDLRRSQLFRELPRSPIAAILLAQLVRERTGDLPANLPDLYAKYVELMLGRWDIDKGLQSQKEYDALSAILMNIAEYMVENELVEISVAEARGMFDAYLSRRNFGLSVDELFERLESRCELVVIDPVHHTFSFKHRTFAEFLLAKRLANRLERLDERAFDPYWMNTFFFAVGLVRDAPELLRSLIDLQPADEGARWLKMINLANYLLAGYATPYDVIEEGVYRAAVEAAELYLNTVEGRSEIEFLSRLPRMHLLWFVQVLMRTGYAFEFLTRAIETAALRVKTEDSLPEKLRPYALFLLNVAYIDLGIGATFDFMLEEYKGQLPLDVSLGIFHESEDFKQRSRLLKKHEQRVKGYFKGAAKKGLLTDGRINDLYYKPIRGEPLLKSGAVPRRLAAGKGNSKA